MTDSAGLRFQVPPILILLPINLGLSIALIPQFGAGGPVIGSAVSVALCQVVPNLLYVRRDLLRRAAAGSPGAHPSVDAMDSAAGLGRAPGGTGSRGLPSGAATGRTSPPSPGPEPPEDRVRSRHSERDGTVQEARPLRVVLTALTYRRAAELAALLPQLAAQARSVDEDVAVVIVDNDPDAGARRQVEAFGHDVRYVHAPTPGIAAARNSALTAAGEADLLVFIDDDERPGADWLARMLATWRISRPAAVAGPVISEFSGELDAWVREGRFFDCRRLPTGTETDVAATNNLLLHLGTVRAAGLRFDERFGLSGGSDTVFTRALHQAGGRIVWCDEAVVTQVVPAERVSRHWVLRRAFRTGNGEARSALVFQRNRLHRARERIRLLARGSVRVAGGSASIVTGAIGRSLALRARGSRTLARGSGMIVGAFGGTYVEYRRD